MTPTSPSPERVPATYDVTFEVTMKLTIQNPNVMDRVLNNEDGWRDSIYDLDEEGVVEMLSRCMGLEKWALSGLDGWADCHATDATVSQIDMTMTDAVRGDGAVLL